MDLGGARKRHAPDAINALACRVLLPAMGELTAVLDAFEIRRNLVQDYLSFSETLSM